MKKKIFLLLLLLTAMTSLVFADGKEDSEDAGYRYVIKGIVIDETGTPLPGATVRVVGTTFGAGTNSKGEFEIRLNKEKDYSLQVSFVGYETATLHVAPSMSPSNLQVKLSPSDNNLGELVVSGSFVERPLKDVPVVTRVISQKDIQALNPSNIETLLQYELPGLQIGYNSMSQLPEIKYQGMDGEYMLFLIDGERVSGEGADHNVDFTRFNIDDIERIEVIKGAQSTIYGSNALGGVINIITKTASRPISANVNVRYAGVNGQRYNASLGIKKDKLTLYSTWTHRQKDSYTIGDSEGKTTTTVNADGTTSQSQDEASSSTVYGYHIYDFTQKLGYTFNERLSVDLKGSYYWNQRDIRYGRLYQEYYVDYTFSAKVKYLLAKQQQITLGYIYDNFKKDNHFFRIDSTYNNYRDIKQTPRLDYTGTFGDHTISAGFEGEFEYLHHYMLADSAHKSNQAYAFYAQEDWRVTDNVDIVAGVRADYHEKYKWHVTPKFSAMWKPWEFLTLRGGYAQGFRSPSLKELYMEYDMGGLGWFIIYGNPDLKPETSNQFSASAEYNKGGLNMSLSFTHNRFHDKIAYMQMEDGDISDMLYVNAESARTTSLEAILRYRFAFGLTLTGSYAFTDDYEEVDGLNTSMVRPHSIVFNALYNKKFGKIGFNCSLNGQWGSGFDTYTIGTDGSYSYVTYDARTLCSLNAGVTLPRGVSVSVGVDNLFNYKDKAVDSSLQVPQKGISFVGTLNLNIADMFKL